MELILILLVFLLLGGLGAIAGADSRDGLDWKRRERLIGRSPWRTMV